MLPRRCAQSGGMPPGPPVWREELIRPAVELFMQVAHQFPRPHCVKACNMACSECILDKACTVSTEQFGIPSVIIIPVAFLHLIDISLDRCILLGRGVNHNAIFYDACSSGIVCAYLPPVRRTCQENLNQSIRILLRIKSVRFVRVDCDPDVSPRIATTAHSSTCEGASPGSQFPLDRLPFDFLADPEPKPRNPFFAAGPWCGRFASTPTINHAINADSGSEFLDRRNWIFFFKINDFCALAARHLQAAGNSINGDDAPDIEQFGAGIANCPTGPQPKIATDLPE